MARTFVFPVILHIHTRRLRLSLQGVPPSQPQLPPLAAPALLQVRFGRADIC